MKKVFTLVIISNIIYAIQAGTASTTSSSQSTSQGLMPVASLGSSNSILSAANSAFLGGFNPALSTNLASQLGSSLSTGSDSVLDGDCFQGDHDVNLGGCSHNCRPNEWGIDRVHGAGSMRPGYQSSVGSNLGLGVTVIPAQILETYLTENSTSWENVTQLANRTERQIDKFEACGCFQATTFDVGQDLEFGSEGFYRHGKVCTERNDTDMMHDLSCHCGPLSTEDLLEFQEPGLKCGHCIRQVDNPEKDIEDKVNKQIYKSIGQVLSEIVNKAITGSLEGAIEIE